MVPSSKSPFWDSRVAADTLQRIRTFEEEKTHRPTALVPIIDSACRPLLVRHVATGYWGLIQGHIDLNLDKHPTDTALRESYEEGCVTKEAVAKCFHYLGETRFFVPQAHETGFSQGGYYVTVGLQLKTGADVSVTPPLGYEKALLDRCWASSLEEAVEILQAQPGVTNVSPRLRLKTQAVLIPALTSIFHHSAHEFLEILQPIM